jgi:hypothetical protein
MSNSDIYKRLEFVAAVWTMARRIQNDVIALSTSSLTVRSKNTGRNRIITYDQLRNAANETRNGCVVRAVARILGLY